MLQQYHRLTLIGKQLETSIALLQLQLGTSKGPLALDYEECGRCAPLSWIKMLWRTLQIPGFELRLKYDKINIPGSMMRFLWK